MPPTLIDPETDSLARQLAEPTGEPVTEAVRRSVADRLRAERVRRGAPTIDRAAIDILLARYDALPVLDDRTADEIIGYDENGLPV